MKLISKLLGTVLLVLGLTTAAAATSFSATSFDLNDFSNISDKGKYGYQWLDYEKNGISLTVTARQGEKLSDSSWIYKTNKKGLGVKKKKGDLSSLDGTTSSLSQYKEGILFTFDQDVSLSSMGFRSVDSDDDMVLLDGSDILIGTYDIKKGRRSNEGNVTFKNSPTGKSFLVTTDNWNDDFYIKSLEVTPTVPVPSTVLLLGAGLVGLVGFRKQAAA